jgi:hypothetical protein
LWSIPEDSLSAIQLRADVSVDLESINRVGLCQISSPSKRSGCSVNSSYGEVWWWWEWLSDEITSWNHLVTSSESPCFSLLKLFKSFIVLP